MARTIVVMRHSKAVPMTEGITDRDRPLSAEGFALALKRAESLANRFQLGIVSSRLRTRQTLEVVAGQDFPVRTFPELFEHGDPAKEEVIDRVYGQLKGHPLSSYMAHPEASPIVDEFARRGWGLIMDTVRESGAENVLVVNHEVYAPAIIRAGCGSDDRFDDLLLDTSWPECHGVELVMGGEKVRNILPLTPL